MPYSRAFSRRSVLTSGLTLFGGLATRAAFGQPVSPDGTRAAIVIGIDDYPDLPHLNAAVSGAEQVSDFLESEGFEVVTLTDRAGLVRAYQIADAIEDFVRRGTFEQLVIYFSGHGTMAGTSEYWLLSKAPFSPSEAISVTENAHLARQSGIPNVVLISDACRSVPQSLGLASVSGQPVFPAAMNIGVHVDVDQFFAALPGNPALELPVEQSVAQHEGIFTTAFLRAFQEPDSKLVVTLPNGLRVVPNRNLLKYLVREVQARAQARSIRLNQVPDAWVNSDPSVYIAQVRSRPPTSLPPDVDLANASVSNAVGDLAQEYLRGDTSGPIRAASVDETRNEASQLIIDAAEVQSEDVILDETGVAVYGARIAEIVGPGVDANLMSENDGAQAWVVYIGDRQAAAALVIFEDGTSAPVAILRDFGAHLTVDETGVTDMRYNPTRENYLFSEFAYEIGYETGEPGRLAFLRATASEARSQGVLRFDGTDEERRAAASRFAGNIRMGKGLDPTLGIFAAYAYAQGFLDEGAISVHRIMKDSLGASLFDTALLAGSLREDCANVRLPVVPQVPMMRQGWELLRPRGVTLLPGFELARSHLRQSLWTTFTAEGTELVQRDARTEDRACHRSPENSRD